MASRIDHDPRIKAHGLVVGCATATDVVLPGETFSVWSVIVLQRGKPVGEVYAGGIKPAYRKAWVLARAFAEEAEAVQVYRRGKRKARRSA